MLVETKPFGEIEVDERQIITFPLGIIGFEESKSFALLDATQSPFYWLQSTEEPEIAFVVIQPEFFRPDYTPSAPMEDYATIEVDSNADALIFVIVTIPHDDHAKMSANLQGPILINKLKRLGRQSVSSNQIWQTRHLILEELAAAREAEC